MRRICQPPVRECVAHQQVAEFVMDAGDWNWKCGQQQEAKSDNCKEQHPSGKNSPFRKTHKGFLCPAQSLKTGK